MLNAELPDLSLDFSGLEIEPLDWDTVVEQDMLPANGEAPAPTAEETVDAAKSSLEPANRNGADQQLAGDSGISADAGKSFDMDMELHAPSAAWGAEAEDDSHNSSFSYDYRTAALRNATMLDLDIEDSDDVNPDAFEGAEGSVPAIEVRVATADDIKDIIDLASEMVTASMSPYRSIDAEDLRSGRRSDMQSLYNLIKSPDFGAFVARDNRDRFIGHVLVKTGIVDFLTGESQAWIFDIAVQPKYWGSGISKRLLQHAEAFARERGIRYIGLTVTTSNTRALRFYQHANYQEERYQMVKCLQPIDIAGNEE